jgi:hypothetical protein
MRRLTLATIAMLGVPGIAGAALTVVLQSGPIPVGPNFAYDYEIQINGDERLDTTATSGITCPGPGSTFVQCNPTGTFLTIYDIPGFVSASTSAAGWTFSHQLNGLTPSAISTATDNGALVNVTFSYTSSTIVHANGSIVIFSGFEIVSTLSGLNDNGGFSSQNTSDNPTDPGSTVQGIGSVPIPACTAITVLPASGALPPGTIGTPYSQTFTQSGGVGTITWSISAGSPPPLLSLDPSTGILSGTPTAQAVNQAFTVRATDANGCIGETAYTLTINCQAITVTPPGVTSAIVGMPFSQDFTQTGAIGGATFAITSGTIPGLALSSGGVLSGIPTTPGTFPITVTVTDGNGCTGSTPYTLTVVVPIPALGWSGLLALAVLLAMAAILVLRRIVTHG